MNMKYCLKKVICVVLSFTIICAFSVQAFAVTYESDFEEGGYLGYSYTASLRADPVFATASVSYAKTATLKVKIVATLGAPAVGFIYGTDTATNTAVKSHGCRATWNNGTGFLAVWVNSWQYINGDCFMRDLYVTVSHLQSINPDVEVE